MQGKAAGAGPGCCLCFTHRLFELRVPNWESTEREGQMFMRKVAVAAGLLLLVSVHSALAQTASYLVCWADNKSRCSGPFASPSAVHYPCDSVSPPGGFSPPFVCMSLCGAPLDAGCKIFPGPGGSGGQCGHRAARVECR
jgi:hypothetical protein